MRKLLGLVGTTFLALNALHSAPPVSARGPSNAGQPSWQGPDGVALPFTEEEELLQFLRTAAVTNTQVLPSGKNRPLKVRLEKDGIQANAVFRSVDREEEWTTIYGKSYRHFRDSCFYEYAAYELSRLLGLDNVPPCVIRTVKGREGTLQLWIEDAETMKDRVEAGTLVTNRQLARQRQMMLLFDTLIHNFDRNLGNMLLDASGKLWLIDHTRSFSLSSQLEDSENIVWCERGMWERMKTLHKDLLSERLGPKVDYGRIIALLKRRDELVEHIQALINERGEDVVLFDREAIDDSSDRPR